MKIAVTGATGFLGRYIVKQLISEGHSCRCWKRPSSDITGFEGVAGSLEWIDGDLANGESHAALIEGCDAVVHAALARPVGFGFRDSGDKNFAEFLECNLMGSLSLMNASRMAGVEHFIFISTCAVHEVILEDRLLDEAHPLWPQTHYGAYKAAVEKFVHSFGLGGGWNVCSLRPTGIYGLAHPAEKSKWVDLIRKVKTEAEISLSKGGKEVHAADVAKAVSMLLHAEGIAGQVFNCYDMYISEGEVARIAKEILGSQCEINDTNQGPKNRIDTHKIQAVGMKFGGKDLLKKTVEEMIRCIPF